jgi:hypothetical protein
VQLAIAMMKQNKPKQLAGMSVMTVAKTARLLPCVVIALASL